MLGNPSDAYGGRCLGFTFTDFAVELSVAPAQAQSLDCELVEAGWSVFRSAPESAERIAADTAIEVRFESDIPRQVGLSGSSAILVALLRALSEAFGVGLSALRIAELALRAEVDQLGLRAGPLDRLVQAHEGFLALDCAQPFAAGSVVRLDPGSLPALLIAWDPRPGQVSGVIHEPVWERWQRGDERCVRVMRELAELCDRGRRALLAGDHDGFRAAIDRNFDLRKQLFAIAPRDQRLVDIARQRAAAAKFCGSGGASLVVPVRGENCAALAAAYAAEGFETLRPTLSSPGCDRRPHSSTDSAS